MAPIVIAAVVLHNGGGLLLGWLSGVALHLGIPQRRALSIEVGMQNSGLAVVLAVAHFSPEAAAARRALQRLVQHLRPSARHCLDKS